MKLRAMFVGLAGLLMLASPALAQATYNNAVGVWGQDSVTGLPCIIAPSGGSATCVIPTGIVANDATFDDAAIGTIGSAPPVGADNIGIIVGGVMRSISGSNPSGSLYVPKVDLSAVNGVTALAGNGVTGTGSPRVTIASDNTPFHVIVDTLVNPVPAGTNVIGGVTCALCATAANQVTAQTSLSAIATSTGAGATAAKQPALGAAGTPSADVITVQGAGAGTPIPVVVAGNSFANITTATTTTVKSGAGVLHTVCVNGLGTVASAAVLYNNTAASGAKIGTLNTLALLGCQTYDIDFDTGLTIVTTGTAAPDITVSYR